LTLHTSLSGGALALARTINLPATATPSGFETEEFTLLDGSNNPLEFVQIQAKIIPGANVTGELQSMRISVRKVGTYLNGAAGIIYDSGVLDMGA
jgi:hypothetical protein